jgi:ArsR family transcriptional regulator
MNIKRNEICELQANMCKVFASPIRIEIIDFLKEGERSVSEIEQVLDIRQAALSQHLSVLREKGVVTTRRAGHNIYYHVSNPKILQACRLMREVLLEQLEQSSRLLADAADRQE